MQGGAEYNKSGIKEYLKTNLTQTDYAKIHIEKSL